MASSITPSNTMEPSNSSSTNYKLYDKWTLWAHLPHDTNWTFESYIKLLTFNNAHEIIMLLETLPEEMITNCMLFLMGMALNRCGKIRKIKKAAVSHIRLITKV